jgi:hypothetical protein
MGYEGVKTNLSCFPRQGNRVKGSFRDEACEEVVVPSGSFTLETHGAWAGARSLRRRHSASRKTISIAQGKPFSIAERSRTSGPSAPASNATGVN